MSETPLTGGMVEATRLFLASLPPDLAEALRAASAPHWFDAGVLAAMLDIDQETSGRRCETLQTLPMVRRFGESSFTVHELTRGPILDDLWANQQETYHLWSRRAAGHFEVQADGSAQARIEGIYHRLLADPEKGADEVWEWGAEWNNTFQYALLHSLIQAGMEHDHAGRLAGRAKGWVYFWYGSLQQFFGKNAIAKTAFETALAHTGGDQHLEASCTNSLGNVHYILDKYEDARSCYEKALSLYQAIGIRVGEANCIRSLGDVNLSLSEYGTARGRYEEALPVYRAIGDRLGEANCIFRLGDVHMSLAEYEEARGRYNQALTVYQIIAARVGEANCILSLGDVHLRLAEYTEARIRYKEALLVYQSISDRLGEANCIHRLGDVYLGLAEYAKARAHYEEALNVYRAIGDRLGEANSIKSLGDLHLSLGEYTEARVRYLEAMPVYHAIGSRWGFSSSVP